MAHLLPNPFRLVQIVVKAIADRCHCLHIPLQKPAGQDMTAAVPVKNHDPLQSPEIVQLFQAEFAFGRTVRIGAVKIQRLRHTGKGPRREQPVAHCLVIFIDPPLPEGIARHILPADQFGAGHPAGVGIPVPQGKQGLFIHFQSLIRQLPGRIKVLRKHGRFQHGTHTDPSPAFHCRPVENFQHLGMDPVVAVHKAQPLPFCQRQGMVPCGGLALVFLMDGHYPGIPGGILLADGTAAIGTAIVHQNHLNIGKGLRQDAVHTLSQVAFRPVNRDDHTDFRHQPVSPSTYRFIRSL